VHRQCSRTPEYLRRFAGDDVGSLHPIVDDTPRCRSRATLAKSNGDFHYVTPITLEHGSPQYRTSRMHHPTPPEDRMRHLSAARDFLVPLAGIAFFVMLATLVA
jgi:hypothetical protein